MKWLVKLALCPDSGPLKITKGTNPMQNRRVSFLLFLHAGADHPTQRQDAHTEKEVEAYFKSY